MIARIKKGAYKSIKAHNPQKEKVIKLPLCKLKILSLFKLKYELFLLNKQFPIRPMSKCLFETNLNSVYTLIFNQKKNNSTNVFKQHTQILNLEKKNIFI